MILVSSIAKVIAAIESDVSIPFILILSISFIILVPLGIPSDTSNVPKLLLTSYKQSNLLWRLRLFVILSPTIKILPSISITSFVCA